jgi:RNA polymerase sigma-70 factor, ECF subfamily
VDETTPVAELIERLRAGDSQVAQMLFTRYAKRLIRLAEHHLSRRLAGRLDGEDVVQSVFRTFFRRNAAGEFHFDDSIQIWQLLVKITLLKTCAKGRYHSRGRRDVKAEAHGSDAFPPEALAHDPQPDEAVALVDEIEALLAGLPPLYCQILDLRLQGVAVTEIASQLAVSRRTVYRALTLLQERLTSRAAAPALSDPNFHEDGGAVP